jgi:hypothetical protein
MINDTQQTDAPVLFDGHGHDLRYDGPLSVSPTVSAAYGEGGGNIPLVLSAYVSKPPAEDGKQEGGEGKIVRGFSIRI